MSSSRSLLCQSPTITLEQMMRTEPWARVVSRFVLFLLFWKNVERKEWIHLLCWCIRNMKIYNPPLFLTIKKMHDIGGLIDNWCMFMHQLCTIRFRDPGLADIIQKN
jgi:hypothetical protein